MVELALPKNSRITAGKTWPKPAGAKALKEFRIYRWDPDVGENPRIDTYFVDRQDCGLFVDGFPSRITGMMASVWQKAAEVWPI